MLTYNLIKSYQYRMIANHAFHTVESNVVIGIINWWSWLSTADVVLTYIRCGINIYIRRELTAQLSTFGKDSGRPSCRHFNEYKLSRRLNESFHNGIDGFLLHAYGARHTESWFTSGISFQCVEEYHDFNFICF